MHKMNIGNNIKVIRELRDYTQDYMADKLDMSQGNYSRIEKGAVVPNIDRLQSIADILEVDLSALLSTTNFYFNFNEVANQSGYITNQNNTNIDIEMIRKIIQEELKK